MYMDPTGHEMLPMEGLYVFAGLLGSPLGAKAQHVNEDDETIRLLQLANIPLHSGKVHYFQVLHSLSEAVAKDPAVDPIPDQAAVMLNKLDKKTLKAFPMLRQLRDKGSDSCTAQFDFSSLQIDTKATNKINANGGTEGAKWAQEANPKAPASQDAS